MNALGFSPAIFEKDLLVFKTAVSKLQFLNFRQENASLVTEVQELRTVGSFFFVVV